MFSTLYRVFWIYKNEDVLIQWSITSEAIFNKKKSIENIAKIIKWNYLKIDLNKYDFIYIYLLPKIIDKAEKRIWEKAKKWTIIFSNAFKFINHTPIEILKDEKGKEEIYVYKV